MIDSEHLSPIQCSLVDIGEGYLVMLEEDVSTKIASIVNEFNKHLLNGADFVDYNGNSFGVTYPISQETIQKLEFALSCQTECCIEFVP